MISRIFASILWVPLDILPIILYALLFWKAQKSRQRVPTITDIAQDSQEAKKEWRATITFSLLFLDTGLLTTLPGIVSLVATAVSGATDSLDSIWFYLVDSVAVSLFFLPRIVDAIFILRNRDIKDALAKVRWLPPFWYTCKCEDITCKPPPEDANNNQI